MYQEEKIFLCGKKAMGPRVATLGAGGRGRGREGQRRGRVQPDRSTKEDMTHVLLAQVAKVTNR